MTKHTAQKRLNAVRLASLGLALGATLLSAANVALAKHAPAPRKSGDARKGEIPLLGKPTAPIAISYEVTPADPQPGQAAQIVVRVVTDAKDVQLRAQANSRVTLTEADTSQDLGDLVASAPASPVLHAQMVSSGNAYVHLRISGLFEGQRMTRVVSIPVNRARAGGDEDRDVGVLKRGARPPGAGKASGGDDAVISMPSE